MATTSVFMHNPHLVSVSPRTEIVDNGCHHIGDFCLITCKKLILGKGCQINAGTKILGDGEVTIGNDAVIGYDCILFTATDTFKAKKCNDASPESERGIWRGNITIGDDCFVGSKNILLPDTILHNGARIKAQNVFPVRRAEVGVWGTDGRWFGY